MLTAIVIDPQCSKVMTDREAFNQELWCIDGTIVRAHWFDAEWIRDWLDERGIKPVIPHRGEIPETRHPDFEREMYRRRNVIERRVGWLKECRRLFARPLTAACNNTWARRTPLSKTLQPLVSRTIYYFSMRTLLGSH